MKIAGRFPSASRACASLKVFRHSLATWLFANGADPNTAEDLMRHATAKVTVDTYAKWVAERKRTANAKVVEFAPRGKQEKAG